MLSSCIKLLLRFVRNISKDMVISRKPSRVKWVRQTTRVSSNRRSGVSRNLPDSASPVSHSIITVHWWTLCYEYIKLTVNVLYSIGLCFGFQSMELLILVLTVWVLNPSLIINNFIAHMQFCCRQRSMFKLQTVELWWSQARGSAALY